MRKLTVNLSALIALLAFCSTIGIAQELKLPPNSHLDEKASSEASKTVPGKVSQVYTTSEPYEKVLAFYKALYTQDTLMPALGPKLPTNQHIQWAFFMLDGGKSMRTSKYWMKIQYPYVGGADGKEIRNVVVIQSVRTK